MTASSHPPSGERFERSLYSGVSEAGSVYLFGICICTSLTRYHLISVSSDMLACAAPFTVQSIFWLPVFVFDILLTELEGLSSSSTLPEHLSVQGIALFSSGASFSLGIVYVFMELTDFFIRFTEFNYGVQIL